MKCYGCGDNNIVITSCVPLCERCADNTIWDGAMGDMDHEEDIISTADIISKSEKPEAWEVSELTRSDSGSFAIEL